MTPQQTRHLEGDHAKLVDALQADVLYGVALGGEHDADYTGLSVALRTIRGAIHRRLYSVGGHKGR